MMAKKQTAGTTKSKTPVAKSASKAPAEPGIPSGVFTVGALLLAGALVTALVLSLSYIPGFTPPGCGEGGGCDKLKNHPASRVPGINWPVAYVGFAYFAAALTAWIGSRKTGLSSAAVWVARLGALASAVYIVIMLNAGTICSWCLATHVLNLLFVGLVEFATPRDRKASSGAMWRTGLTVFALVTALAGGVQLYAMQEEKAKDRQAIDALLDQLHQSQPATPPSGTTTPPAVAPTPAPKPTAPITTPPLVPPAANDDSIVQLASVPYELPTSGPGRDGFTGRYLVGPEQAQVRLVVLSCFQCPDCKRVKGEIDRILREHPTVSLSHKHYPFNGECNSNVNRAVHPGACQASRLVEAAGLVGGPGAFWEMNAWAFDHFSKNSVLKDADLDTKLNELGMDPAAVRRAMASKEVEALIAADTAEGHTLGLSVTPMVFINGQEFRRWQREGTLSSVVAEALKGNPAVADASGDQPANAIEKMVEDWRTGAAMPDLASPWGYALGQKDNPSATVTLYGCYASQRTREADRLIRTYLEEHPDVKYTYRMYPMSAVCNAGYKGMAGQGACEYARAALAAGRLGGEEAFWAMHKYIMDLDIMQGPGPTMLVDEVAKYAPSRAEAEKMIDSDVVDRSLMRETQTDAAMARLRIEGVPRVFVNDKWVMNWRWDGHLVMYDAIDAARGLKQK